MISFALNAPLNLGQFTDGQTERIQRCMLDAKYNTVASNPVVKIYDNGNGGQVIITPQQYSFKLLGKLEYSLIESGLDISNNLLEILFPSAEIEACSFTFTDILEPDTDNLAEQLLKLSSFDYSKEALKDITTIGYRFLIKKENLFDEIKFEPYLKDINKLFVEGVFNNEHIQISNIQDCSKKAFNSIVMKINTLTEL